MLIFIGSFALVLFSLVVDKHYIYNLVFYNTTRFYRNRAICLGLHVHGSYQRSIRGKNYYYGKNFRYSHSEEMFDDCRKDSGWLHEPTKFLITAMPSFKPSAIYVDEFRRQHTGSRGLPARLRAICGIDWILRIWAISGTPFADGPAGMSGYLNVMQTTAWNTHPVFKYPVSLSDNFTSSSTAHLATYTIFLCWHPSSQSVGLGLGVNIIVCSLNLIFLILVVCSSVSYSLPPLGLRAAILFISGDQ